MRPDFSSFSLSDGPAADAPSPGAGGDSTDGGENTNGEDNANSTADDSGDDDDEADPGDTADSSPAGESGEAAGGDAAGADEADADKPVTQPKGDAQADTADDEHGLKDVKDPKDLRVKFNERLGQYKGVRDTVQELGGVNAAKRLAPLASTLNNPDSSTKDILTALPQVLGQERYQDVFNEVFWTAIDDPEVSAALASDERAQKVFIEGMFPGRKLSAVQIKEAVEAVEGVTGNRSADGTRDLDPNDPLDAELIRLREESAAREKPADGKEGKPGDQQTGNTDPAQVAATEAENDFFTEAVSIVEGVTGGMEWAETSGDSELEKKYKQRALPYVQANIQSEVLTDPEAKKLFEKAVKWIGKGRKAEAMDVLDELRPHIRRAAAKLASDADEIIQLARENRTLKGKSATDFRADHDTTSSSGSGRTGKAASKPAALGSNAQRSGLANAFRDAMKESRRS